MLLGVRYLICLCTFVQNKIFLRNKKSTEECLNRACFKKNHYLERNNLAVFCFFYNSCHLFAPFLLERTIKDVKKTLLVGRKFALLFTYLFTQSEKSPLLYNRKKPVNTKLTGFFCYVDGGSRTECVMLSPSNDAASRMWVHLRVHIHMGSPKMNTIRKEKVLHLFQFQISAIVPDLPAILSVLFSGMFPNGSLIPACPC